MKINQRTRKWWIASLSWFWCSSTTWNQKNRGENPLKSREIGVTRKKWAGQVSRKLGQANYAYHTHQWMELLKWITYTNSNISPQPTSPHKVHALIIQHFLKVMQVSKCIQISNELNMDSLFSINSILSQQTRYYNINFFGINFTQF